MQYMSDIELKIDELKKASVRLSSSTAEERNEALALAASELKANAEYIFNENRKDLENAVDKVSPAVMKRLLFDEGKLETVVSGIESIIGQKDPVGRVIEKRELDEGLILSRVSVPIGVIGMIFEARPDALVQMVSLAIKSGNALILKGGSEARLSNRALFETIVKGLEKSRLGSGYIMLLESREDVSEMLGMSGKIDLLIPRGSNEFVKYIMHNTELRGRVAVAGSLQVLFRGEIKYSWMLVFYFVAALFIALAVYHKVILPTNEDEEKHKKLDSKKIFKDLLDSVRTFIIVVKPDGKLRLRDEAVTGILFMLCYRMPEGLLAKITPLFLCGKAADGGMALSLQEYSFAYGTVGVIGLVAGGIIGGLLG